MQLLKGELPNDKRPSIMLEHSYHKNHTKTNKCFCNTQMRNLVLTNKSPSAICMENNSQIQVSRAEQEQY